MEDSPDVLDILRDLLNTEQAFYQTIRLLDSGTRNHLVAGHLRNTSTMLSLLRTFMSQPQTMVINMDMSGNFFDAVPVVPTREQITAATEMHMSVPPNTTCAICQDEVTCATRIRACGHNFHGACVDQWFQMNPRCPVCRHDIREPLTNANRNLPQ
jgi:hypothetical protein